ncbi:MAG: DivIVA domain-containing protein [Oscillibacter sp.]|nr:DivIVA domain-containing protein [Oscillibacter sp.]
MLTPQEVSTHAFTKSMMGGYNMAMVDEFLDELTEDYTALYKENAALKAKMKVLVEKVEEYRATEDSMRATLLTAQRMADSIVHEAESKRDSILVQTDADIDKRKQQLQKELTALETRMREGQTELKRFIIASQEICKKELAFLEKLPELPLELPAAEPAFTPAAVQPEPAPPPEPEPEPETPPLAEVDISAGSEYPEEDPFEEEEEAIDPADEPTRRINLEDLKFGRNYTSGG